MEQHYTYRKILSAAARAGWQIDDVMPEGHAFDFGRPFMPESLARVEPLDFLCAEERRALNHIRAHGYLRMFGLVEEFILPFVMDHARPQLGADDYQTRALLLFAGEEAKHIQLFHRFAAAFERGFATDCEVIGPPEAIDSKILSHPPLAVAHPAHRMDEPASLRRELKDDDALEPQFKSLLRHHWMEEAQHARLDTLMVEALAAKCSAEETERAAEEYLEIGAFLDAGLEQQMAFDLDAFERATDRTLRPAEHAAFSGVQRQALRWTFLGSGMTHPRFRSTLEKVAPVFAAKLAAAAPAFC